MAVWLEVEGARETTAWFRGMARKFPGEAARAVEDGARAARAEFSRQARAVTTVKSASVRANVRVGGRASAGKPVSSFRISGRELPVTSFQARAAARGGVRIRIWRDRPATLLRSAFRKPGNPQWFIRASDPSRPSGLVGRLPIRLIRGIALTRVYDRDDVDRAVTRRGAEVAQASLTRRLDRLVGRH